MACFSMLFPWLVGFGNEDPKWTFAISILSCLHLSIVQNISKAFLDQTIMPFLNMLGNMYPTYLHYVKWTASFQYGATCAWKPVALVTGAAETRLTEISTVRSSVKTNTQNINWKVTLARLGCCSTKMVLYYFLFFSWAKSGEKMLWE